MTKQELMSLKVGDKVKVISGSFDGLNHHIKIGAICEIVRIYHDHEPTILSECVEIRGISYNHDSIISQTIHYRSVKLIKP